MPRFNPPFSALASNQKRAHKELIQEDLISLEDEFEAIPLYKQFAETTNNKLVEKVRRDVAYEERNHGGESLSLLYMITPDEDKFYIKGQKKWRI